MAVSVHFPCEMHAFFAITSPPKSRIMQTEKTQKHIYQEENK